MPFSQVNGGVRAVKVSQVGTDDGVTTTQTVSTQVSRPAGARSVVAPTCTVAGTWYSALLMSGPGAVSLLALARSVNAAGSVDWRLKVDGVVVASSTTSLTSNATYMTVVPVVGTFNTMLEEGSDLEFSVSLEVEIKSAAAGTAGAYVFYKARTF